MILTLKIILIIIMCISFMGAVAEEKKDSKMSMTAICIASIFATIAAFIWLD